MSLDEKVVVVTTLSRGKALSLALPVDVSLSNDVRHFSPNLWDEETLQVGESAVQKSLFLLEEKDEPWKIVLKKLIDMETELVEIKEGNIKMSKRLDELEEEQVTFFLGCVTEKWLSLFGKQKLSKHGNIEDVKGLLRQKEDALEKIVKLSSTKGSFEDHHATNLRLKKLDAKLMVWRRKLTDDKVFGLEAVGAAQQLEMLLQSYLHVNENAHSSITSERWKKCEANAIELAERGHLIIEGVNVGSLVKLMLGNLKAVRSEIGH